VNVGVSTCKAIHSILTKAPLRWVIKPPALGDRKDMARFAEWDLATAGTCLSWFAPYDRMEDKSVLDVGCGWGGKSAFCSQLGASFVQGIDTDADRIEGARQLAERKGIHNVHFDVGDAAHLPYASETFDVTMFLDSMEHVHDPGQSLAEAHRVLKPEGTVLIAFPPYGSPWGGHLFERIRIPWAQLLFSERTLLNVWRQADLDQEVQALKDASAPPQGLHELLHLNKMSLHHFEEVLESSPFSLRLMRLKMLARSAPMDLSGKLTANRILREHLVTRVTAVLQK